MAAIETVAPTPESFADMAPDATQVIVMRPDGTQVLTSAWFIQEEYSDVVAALIQLFGTPSMDAVMPINQDMVDATMSVIHDPDLKISFNGS